MTTQTQQESKSMLKTFIPNFDWLPKVDKSWIRGDVITALTIWALLVPEGMGPTPELPECRPKPDCTPPCWP